MYRLYVTDLEEIFGLGLLCMFESPVFFQMRMRLNYFERAQREWMEEKTLVSIY